MPLAYKLKKWTPAEMANLAKGVRQQNQQILLNKLYKEFNTPNSDLSLDEFNKEMSKIKSMSDRELEENTEGINWDLIAKTYVPTRPGEDCKIQWLASGHPSINRSAWTKPEDKKLLDLVEKYRGYRWVDISKELGTNRTPAQCFMRSSNLKPNIVRGCWTKEEDRTLGAAVQRYGPKNWQQVANCLKEELASSAFTAGPRQLTQQSRVEGGNLKRIRYLFCQ